MNPLINSTTPNIKEKRKNELKFFFGFKNTNKYATKAQNNAKNPGTKIIVKGIKNFKFSSKVNEIDIQ